MNKDISRLLEARAREILEDLAAEVMRRPVTEFNWQIHTRSTKFYALSAMLIFVAKSAPIDELVVVSMTLERDPVPEWVPGYLGPRGSTSRRSESGF